MTFILGILSVFQAIFLPGYIISRGFLPLKHLSRTLIAFALSPLINYQFVFLFTSLGIYKRATVFIFFAIECLVLIWLVKRPASYHTRIDPFHPQSNVSNLRVKESWRGWFNTLFSAFALYIAFTFILKILLRNPIIFDSWDDVVSWNRWANDWYKGILPIKTWHYPQAIPANWSMIYHFVGSPDIQPFAKFMMNMFPFAILGGFYDLYKNLKSEAFLAGAGFSGFLVLALVGVSLGTGYVDITIAFYCFIIFYSLLLTSRGFLPLSCGLMLSTALLATVVLIKQGGLFMLFPFIIATILIFFKNRQEPVNKKRLIAFMLAGYMLLVLPYYIYKEIQIKEGIEKSEVGWVTHEIYAGKTKLQRLEDASVRFRDAVTDITVINSLPEPIRPATKLVFFSILIFLSCLSLASSMGRFVMLLIVVPYYLIWALFFSYDLRNLSLVIAFWGFALGTGIVVGLNVLAHIPSSRRKWTAIGLMLFFATFISIKFPRQRLLAMERRMAMENILDPELNKLLYQHLDSGNMKGKVLSSYPMGSSLPDVRDHLEPFVFDESNLENLKSILGKNGTKYQFCVVNYDAPPVIWEYFKELEQKGLVKSKTKTMASWTLIEFHSAP